MAAVDQQDPFGSAGKLLGFDELRVGPILWCLTTHISPLCSETHHRSDCMKVDRVAKQARYFLLPPDFLMI